MKKLDGKIHMSRAIGGGFRGATVELTDKSSGILITNIHLTPEQVGALIVGFPTECSIELYDGADKYGKHEEVKTEYVDVPEAWRLWKGDAWRQAWIALTSKLEVDGWKADSESSYSIRRDTDRGYPVTMRRYIDPSATAR